MVTLTHIISASYIGARAAGVSPTETNYIILTFLSAGILDIDHVYYLIKNRAFYKSKGYKGNLHNARSFLHELPGFLVTGIIMLMISLFNYKLALLMGIPMMIHLAQDLLAGVSIPFSPVDKTQITLIPQKTSYRIALDVVFLVTFSILWIKFLYA